MSLLGGHTAVACNEVSPTRNPRRFTALGICGSYSIFGYNILILIYNMLILEFLEFWVNGFQVITPSIFMLEGSQSCFILQSQQ